MTSTMKKAKYSILTLQKEHIESTVKLFVRSFCDSEPITKHLNMPYNDYEPFVREVLQKAVRDGLSVVAVDENNQAIACTIGEDITDMFVPRVDQYPRMKPIFDLLDDVSEPFLSDKDFTPGKIVHVWIAIVDEKHRGQGLSTAIDSACGELAVRKGFDFAYAEFTNPISENITHHYQALKPCNKIEYDNYTTKQNTQPFKGLKGRAESYVIGIRPGIKIDSLANCYTIRKE